MKEKREDWSDIEFTRKSTTLEYQFEMNRKLN
jgi:hypothetical protein